MKPSKYSILIIPDNEEGERQFSITRNQIKLLTFGVVILLSFIIFFIVYVMPKMMHYKKMEIENNKFASERVKIIELMQDLNRIEQMDKLIRKTLGSELNLSFNSVATDSVLYQSSKTPIESDNTVSYVDNVPSQFPVEGYITQKMMVDKLYKNHNHFGIDIAVKVGEPVYASATGFVVFSGWTYNFGNYIILYHGDDYFTVYGHNKINLVEMRDFVKRSDVIAITGSTGITSGPHLHYEIWKDGIPVDPLELFPKYKQKDISVSSYE